MSSFDEFPHWAIKLISLIILFLLSMIFGAIPLRLSRDASKPPSRFRNLLISLSNCFAGGVFLSTVILDLFPGVRDKMDEALKAVDVRPDFPLGDFVIGCGFLLMLTIEQFVHSCCGNTWLGHHVHEHDHQEDVFSHLPDETSPLLYERIAERNKELEDRAGANEDVDTAAKKKVSLGPASVLHGNSISYDSSDEENKTENILEQSHRSNATSVSYETFYSEHGTYHRIPRLKRTKSLASMHSVTHSNFRTFVLVFAISLHSLFEGIAVGVIVKVQLLLQIVIALLIHKSILAFSIGVQLVDADLPTATVLICLAIFAIMAPIGVGIGIGVLNSVNSTTRLFFSGTLQGIATGTFLYVTFFEVLPHELNIEDDRKPLKIFFVLLGFLVIVFLAYYEAYGFHSIPHANVPK